MERKLFGILPDGREVPVYILKSETAECGIIGWGAAIAQLTVPDADGTPVDVALGFDSIGDYLVQDKYIGATVGRFANRIGGSRFILNGETVLLPANEGKNHLHGGIVGFDKRIWAEETEGEDEASSPDEDRVTLSLTSPDGDEGYPGELRVKVTYSLRGSVLTMRYTAVSSRDTVISLTNHAYLNLSGAGSGTVTDHIFRINAKSYLPTDAESIPIGDITPVEGTPMDLTEPCSIADRIDSDFPQLRKARGYDHSYVIDGQPGELRFAAEAVSPKSGVRLRMYTDRPAVQFYTGNFLAGCPAGKDGAEYRDRGGFCFEAQAFPDAPNKPDFPTAVLKKGETYTAATVLAFDTATAEN